MFKHIQKKMSKLASEKYPIQLSIKLPKANNLPLVNSRCHYNAVQAVRTGMAIAVVETVIIYSDGCTAHYVNLLEDGSVVDFTLGQMCLHDDYRLVRYVPSSEYDNINKTLMNLKDSLVAPLSKFEKLFIRDSNNWC